jgi:hypothetical protein
MGSARRPNLTRAREARSAKPAALPRSKPARTSVSHFNDILDRFGHALAIVTVSRIAIEASEKLAQEACALRQGIAGLDAVYNELDLAIGAIGRRGAAGGAS